MWVNSHEILNRGTPDTLGGAIWQVKTTPRNRLTQKCAQPSRTAKRQSRRRQTHGAVPIQIHQQAEAAETFWKYLHHSHSVFHKRTVTRGFRLKFVELWQHLGISLIGRKTPLWTEDIISQRKEHQTENRRQPHRHQNPQCFVTGRFAGDGFIGVKHQVPTIERRHRE